jgi:periplasmic copper chaperone A
MRILALLTAVSVALLAASTASAHITASPTELPAGYTYAEFSVPHGCEGSATTRISIKIPAGIAGVKPQEVTGWTIAIKQGTLPEPVSIFGDEMTEGVTEVSWAGGPLPDSHMQRFGLSFFASESLAGETVYFPAVQQCEEGVTRWIEIPVEGEEPPEEPAPGIRFLASAEEKDSVPAGETTTGESAGEAAAVPTDSDDDGEDGLTMGFGIAGLVAGLLALGVALFRPGIAARRG